MIKIIGLNEVELSFHIVEIWEKLLEGLLEQQLELIENIGELSGDSLLLLTPLFLIQALVRVNLFGGLSLLNARVSGTRDMNNIVTWENNIESPLLRWHLNL